MEKRDLRVDGNTKTTGGEFGDIYISGSGKITSDAVCQKLYVSGSAKFEGSLKSDSIIISGSFKSYGDVRTRNLEVSGTFKNENALLYADQITISGVLKNEKEINADIINIDGMIKAETLVGDEINITMDSHVNSLIARNISFNKVNTLECTKLNASYLKCNSLSAQEIVLTKHCQINHVHCDGVLSYDSSCEIEEITGECEVRRI